MTRLAETWWAFVVPASAQVAVVALIVAAALWLGRRAAPLVRLALCAVLLLKLAAPTMPSLEVPLLAWREAALPPSPGPVELFAARTELPVAAPGTRNAVGTGTVPVATWSWTALVFALYCAGVAVALARLTLHAVRLHRLRTQGRAVPVTDLPRRVAVREAAGVSAPCCFGVWRPTILLPAGLHERLDPRTRRAVLEHERVHLVHHDPALNLIASLLRALWWFHPAVWWMTPTLRRLQEERCDDAVLRRTGLDPEHYGRSLVAVARDLAGGYRSPLTSSMSRGEHALARRLRRIFDPNRTERTPMLHLTAPVLLAVTLVPGVTPTRIPQDTAEVAPSREAPSGPGQIDRALVWLADQQADSGSFGHSDADGLAVLALLGAGHTDSVGPRKDTVAKALAELERRVSPDQGGSDRAALIAGCALTEHFLLAGSPEGRAPAVQTSVKRAIAASHRKDLDAELAFWSALVLVSAKDAGVGKAETHDAALARLRNRLPLGATSGAEAWTAEATCAASLFLHVATGGDSEHASFQAAKERVLGTLARPVGEDLTLVWLGTMAMYQVGGDAWKHWNAGPLERLGSLQNDAGRFQGEGAHDVTATAFATLALEARYRYARLMGR